MAKNYTLQIVIDAEDRASSKLRGLSGAIEGLSSVGGTLLAGAAGALTAGFGALAAASGVAISEAMNAQQVQAQLGAVLTSTGMKAGVTADMVNDLSDSLSRVTVFTDDAITSAQSMLLTFTNISKDVFPDTTRAVLDMAQALGMDLKSASIMVGKALNDPVEGVGALRRVGVSLTDEQQRLIESMVVLGDVAGAQKVILSELTTEFGGSAEAIGKTVPGKLKIIRNQFMNLAEDIGMRVMPEISQLADAFIARFGDPAIQAQIGNLMHIVEQFAIWLVQNIPPAIGAIIAFGQNLVNFLAQNQGVLVAALAMITAAIAAFAYTTISAAVPAVVAFITAAFPVIAILAAVGVAAYALYQAWTTNFGGIRGAAGEVWSQLQPIFSSIAAWLQVNIPIAINALVGFWNGTLLPAFTVLVNIISTYVIPLITALAQLLIATLGYAFRFVGALIMNIIIPAISQAVSWLSEKLGPVVNQVGGWIQSSLVPAFNAIGAAVSKTIVWIKKLADAISTLKLPKWLTPGSPTPFEIGLRGIADAMMDINTLAIPRMSSAINPDYSRAAPAATQVTAQIDEDRLALAIRDAILRAGAIAK